MGKGIFLPIHTHIERQNYTHKEWYFYNYVYLKKKQEQKKKMEQNQSDHNPSRDETVDGERDSFKSIQISKL